MNIQKVICMQCRKDFEQDMDDPKIIRAYEKAGIVARQCDKCMKKMLEEDSEE